MLIPHPLLGLRDAQEFTYLGDAALLGRPDGLTDPAAFNDYVYLRDNPAGVHRELWFHEQGDRSWLVRFTFDGQSYQGHPGDTLASALLANDVRLVGRSFKYHRPRGMFSAGSEEPNALVELRAGARREPNTRATVTELYHGLEARSQNRWPSLAFDLLSVN